MDVDTPNVLKRCSSAPLIDETAPTAATSPTTNTAPRSTSFFNMYSNSSLPRTRSNSISCSPTSAVINLPGNFQRHNPRLKQLLLDNCADVSNTREVAHEREVHTAMQMGQSCEDLTLVPGQPNSPTRIPRFPALQAQSPHKFTTRRSLSPIPLRASTFGAAGGKRRPEEPARPPAAKRARAARDAPPAAPERTFRPVSPRPQAPLGDERAHANS